jgi:hypothetical protein
MVGSPTFRTLALCSRATGSIATYERVRQEAADVVCWLTLVRDAEAHGLDPLLFRQLLDASISIPSPCRAHLQARWVQHAHAYAVRTRLLRDVVHAMQTERVSFLVLKGAALAHLVYANPVLRPMRDVDLLVRPHEARRACQVLEQCGFSAKGAPVAPDYHHLTGMAKTVDGVTVTIELHHALLRATPFLRPLGYDDLDNRAQPFEWGDMRLRTLGPEDMLWHVYAHAFAINVLCPAIRLISVADLVSLVEAWVDRLDWDRIGREFGQVLRALPLFHDLTPWSPRVLEVLGAVSGRPSGVRPLTSSVVWSGALNRDVLWPPEWWFRVRYGIDGPRRWVWYRFVGHPARLALAAAHTATTRLAKRVCTNRGHVLLARS